MDTKASCSPVPGCTGEEENRLVYTPFDQVCAALTSDSQLSLTYADHPTTYVMYGAAEFELNFLHGRRFRLHRARCPQHACDGTAARRTLSCVPRTCLRGRAGSTGLTKCTAVPFRPPRTWGWPRARRDHVAREVCSRQPCPRSQFCPRGGLTAPSRRG